MVLEVVDVLVEAVLCSGPVLVAVVAVEVVAVAVSGLGAGCSEGLSTVSLPSILSINPLALLIMSLARLSLTRGLD